MEINKQLFEDVLSGKLKGTFKLKNGFTVRSNRLFCTEHNYYPYALKGFSCSFSCEGNTPSIGYDIIDFIPDTDMKENELTIEIPDGKIVDWDESKKQNKIILKDKQLTYEDICKKLFKDDHYIIAWEGYPIKCCGAIYKASNATTEHQLECILAKNKLANVAKYLNDGWKWDCYNRDFGYFICKLSKEIGIVQCDNYIVNNNVIFKSEELARQAIKILGEETVKLSLEPLGI